MHGSISAALTPTVCEDLTWCFSCIMSYNSHNNSMGMILLSRCYELGNLREVTSPRSQSQRKEGQWVKPGVSLSKACAYSVTRPRASQCPESSAPGRPLETQLLVNADMGALSQVSITACATMICFPFWLLCTLEIHTRWVTELTVTRFGMSRSSPAYTNLVYKWTSYTGSSQGRGLGAPLRPVHLLGQSHYSLKLPLPLPLKQLFTGLATCGLTEAAHSAPSPASPSPPALAPRPRSPQGCSACEASPQPFYGRCRYPDFAHEETKSPRS